MSIESLAFARKNLGNDLRGLAQEHFKHDLQQSDRDTLRSAAQSVATQTTVGSLLGLSLGVFLAYRLRSNRAAVFRAFKATEKPIGLQFAGGRTEPLPDVTPLLKPSTAGNIMVYTLLGAGGIFFGGESGLLLGTLSARRKIMQDRESFGRIQRAFNGFQADALRKQADMIEREGRGRI